MASFTASSLFVIITLALFFSSGGEEICGRMTCHDDEECNGETMTCDRKELKHEILSKGAEGCLKGGEACGFFDVCCDGYKCKKTSFFDRSGLCEVNIVPAVETKETSESVTKSSLCSEFSDQCDDTGDRNCCDNLRCKIKPGRITGVCKRKRVAKPAPTTSAPADVCMKKKQTCSDEEECCKGLKCVTKRKGGKVRQICKKDKKSRKKPTTASCSTKKCNTANGKMCCKGYTCDLAAGSTKGPCKKD